MKVFRLTWSAAVAVLVFGLSAGVGGASHGSEPFSHGIAPLKGCNSTTPVGQPIECFYTVMNTVDEAHDTITIDSVVDVVQTAGGAVSSGEILDELEIIASGGATCSGPAATFGGTGTALDPYTGATLCTLPSGSSVTTNLHSFYTVTAADYAVQADHRLHDSVTYGWNDLCDGDDPDGCNPEHQENQAGAATRVVFTPSITTSVNGNGTTVVARGSTVFDTATLTNASPDAGGTITYGLFSDNTCDTLVANLTPSPNAVVNKVVPNSANYLANTLGQFWFQATYSGDANNVGGPFESVCTSEPFKVVDANIHINPPTAVNPLNTNHLLTITVNALNGTLAPGTATASIVGGPGSFVGSPSCNYAGGAATATCEVTITSGIAGTTEIQATSNIPVDTVSITRTTESTLNTAAGGGDNAEKTWEGAGVGSFTPGYWKNHQAHTTSLLPITLGGYSVDTFAKARTVFGGMNCGSSKPQSAYGCLAGHLLAAKLNLANGGSTCIAAKVADANTLLSGGTVNGVTGLVYTGPSGTYNLSAAQRALVVAIKDALDAYNNDEGC